MFPFFISSHSSISVDNQSKTLSAIPTPKANPTAAVIDHPTALKYCNNVSSKPRPSIFPPYDVTKSIFCINSDESKVPDASSIAISDEQVASKTIVSPLDAGTFTLILISFGT